MIGEPAPVPVRPPGLEVTVYAVIAAPPVLAGAVNATSAWALPAVAVPMVGAPGTTALTANVCDTVGAAWVAALPAWSASMVQLPALTKVSAPPAVMVHTAGVDEENVTASPELAVAANVGDVPKFCAGGWAKVMVWLAFGVAGLLALEAVLVPTALVAVTVKV